MRNTFRLGPWLCDTGFHRWCPCLYNLLLIEEHRWLVLFEMTVGNAEWLFSLQIKYPLYSAHSSAKRVTKYLWQPAAMRKKVFRLGPFSFATPAFTGCAFVCTCTPSRSHAQNFTIFSVGRYAGLHTQPFARAEQKSSGSFFSVYHKCPQITSKYL